jgi:hypothetical protein
MAWNRRSTLEAQLAYILITEAKELRGSLTSDDLLHAMQIECSQNLFNIVSCRLEPVEPGHVSD